MNLEGPQVFTCLTKGRIYIDLLVTGMWIQEMMNMKQPFIMLVLKAKKTLSECFLVTPLMRIQ